MNKSLPSNSRAPFSGVVIFVPADSFRGELPAAVVPAARCNFELGLATPRPIASALASKLNKFASLSPSILKSTSAPESLATTAPVIDGASIIAELIVLLVKVSVVSLPTKVVVASGIVTVRSAVGSATEIVVSKASSVGPSRINGEAP